MCRVNLLLRLSTLRGRTTVTTSWVGAIESRGTDRASCFPLINPETSAGTRKGLRQTQQSDGGALKRDFLISKYVKNDQNK